MGIESLKTGPCGKAVEAQLKAAERPGHKFDISMVDQTVVEGMHMESAATMLSAATSEVVRAKDELANASRELRATSAEVTESLNAKLAEFRGTRMAIVNEARDSLGALRDIRKFFMDADYETEMARLERLVAVCRGIQELKAMGVFDAVLDSALRLSVGDMKTRGDAP